MWLPTTWFVLYKFSFCSLDTFVSCIAAVTIAFACNGLCLDDGTMSVWDFGRWALLPFATLRLPSLPAMILHYSSPSFVSSLWLLLTFVLTLFKLELVLLTVCAVLLLSNPDLFSMLIVALFILTTLSFLFIWFCYSPFPPFYLLLILACLFELLWEIFFFSFIAYTFTAKVYTFVIGRAVAESVEFNVYEYELSYTTTDYDPLELDDELLLKKSWLFLLSFVLFYLYVSCSGKGAGIGLLILFALIWISKLLLALTFLVLL